jgi:phosphoserine phosphatase RsbU/P
LIPAEAIKSEFDRSTVKFHVWATWIGLILNIFWSISDALVIPAYFFPFLIFRLVVSGISVFALLFRERLNISIYTCMFILVLGISIQNAYMWSVMDLYQFQKHAFAYMVLFVGVGMLVLWESRLSLLLAKLTIAANLVFYWLNSTLPFEEYLINGGLLTFTVVIFCVFMIRSRYRLTYNEIKSRLELEQSKVEIQQQKDDLQEKNREITDSINYASDIQGALIPAESKFNAHFTESFVLFKPKDIVSGDFYWVFQKKHMVFYVTADCTGHGVPGGFMTMLGLSFLDEIIIGQDIHDPAEVLNLMRDRVISTLNRSGTKGGKKDGMDIVICCIDKEKKLLSCAGANNNIYHLTRNLQTGETNLHEIKGDRQPCGYAEVSKPFTTHRVELQSGDWIYTFTDGYADQFGGPKGKKFRYKQLEELLLKNSHLPPAAQKNALERSLHEWKGDLQQVDDVLVIGVGIT